MQTAIKALACSKTEQVSCVHDNFGRSAMVWCKDCIIKLRTRNKKSLAKMYPALFYGIIVEQSDRGVFNSFH